MKSIYKTVSLSLMALASLSAFAFDWPQSENQADSLYSYFGQLRGGTIESSLIFKDSEEVHAAEKGTLIAEISEHDDDFGWFESTLGNALLLSHEDGLVTVYGNLDMDTLSKDIEASAVIEKGTVLAESGNSGWQEGRSCLEFQVLDTKNAAAINPRILMPRIGTELPLETGAITLQDRNGNTWNLSSVKVISSGNYSIYRTRQSVAVPYKTLVAVNGASVETISYDILRENDGRLCAQGNSSYSSTQLYPDGERQLLSELMLTHGRNKITIVVSDILGKTISRSWIIDVN